MLLKNLKFASMTIIRKNLLFCFVLIINCSMLTAKNNLRIHYSVSIPKPSNHYVSISMEYSAPNKENQEIKLPVWTPGSYMVREFAKNVEKIDVFVNSEKTTVSKSDKSTWHFKAPQNSSVKVVYTVYCFEFSVRTSFVDEDQALLNGASLYMYVPGLEKTRGTIKIDYSDTKWKNNITSLTSTHPPKEENTKNILYEYSNYDELVDAPIQLGNFETFSFLIGGVTHEVAMIGQHNANIQKLKMDMEKICNTMFNIVGQFPIGPNSTKKYIFIVQNVQNGGGGIEHLNSTVLMMNRFNYNKQKEYTSFLGLVGHEYFHLWNVKRIRPVELGPFDYSKENYTNLLWVSEGITSYYDEMVLLRAGYIDKNQFLSTIASYINGHENRPGSAYGNVKEMSWDAWIKEYRPNENSKNSNYSYYSKGLIIGCLLDIEICKATNGEKNLDDVFKLLYSRYLQNHKADTNDKGFTEADFFSACDEVAKKEVSNVLSNWINSSASPNYSELFSELDILAKSTKSLDSNFGIGCEIKNGNVYINFVHRSGTGESLGLNVNDEIIALNNIRINSTQLETIWTSLNKPKQLEFTIQRAGILRIITGEIKPIEIFNLQLETPKSDAIKSNNALTKWLSIDK